MKRNTPETICPVTGQPIGGSEPPAHAVGRYYLVFLSRNPHLHAHEDVRLAEQAVKRLSNKDTSEYARHAPSYQLPDKRRELEAALKRFDRFHAELEKMP